MQIQITSEAVIQEYWEDRPHVVISIQDPTHDFVKLADLKSRRGWIGLKFNDVDPDFIEELKKHNTNAIIFNEQHAETILNFYNEWKYEVDLLIVHCVAGRSRSPAVAAALRRLEYKLDFDIFSRYTPNMHVYRTLLEKIDEWQENERQEKREQE